MKKIIRINICFYVVFLMLLATECETQYLSGDRNTKWKKDLDYLQEALPKKHPNLFFKVSEEQFNKEIDDLKNSLDNLNDGIYVIDTTDEYKEVLYSKLIKINGQDIKSIKDKITPLVAKENEETIKKALPNYLTIPEILHGVKIVDNIDSEVSFTFENRDGKTFDLNVAPLDTKENIAFIINGEYDESYPLYMQNPTYNYWYKYLEDDKTLYLKYNQCLESNKVGKINDFNNEILNFIDNNVDKLVIDMRDNGGGGQDRLDVIIEGIKNKEINNKNKFFVIVGRNTFSAAIGDVVKWRKETNATFIGQETSGKLNHYGSWNTFTLPNSKLTVQYSTIYVNNGEDESDSFMPDKTIEISIDDYVNKKDPVLDYIIGRHSE